ncbi:MAG: site-specific integrase [Ruminococcus sp.]|nr:site-specific integrase [Ruminococcus bromii]
MTVDEQKKLIDVLKSEDIRYSEQMLLSMFTGMRMGEINALEVGDINFNDRTIRVCKTVSRGLNGKTYISNSTKTKAGMRTIYFNDDMADFLKQCIGDKKDGLIFASSVDKLVTTNQVNYQYANTLKKYEILDKSVYGKVDLHSLRHTYATRCIESGMPAKVLQNLLGHTDIRITLDTYCDVFQKYSMENLAVADNYMKSNNIAIV